MHPIKICSGGTAFIAALGGALLFPHTIRSGRGTAWRI